MRGFTVLVACFAVMGTASGHAGAEGTDVSVEATPDRRLPQLLTADPNASHAAMEFRGAIRGRVSDSVEFFGSDRRAGYRIAVTPFVELHEPEGSDQLLPSQYWRGRLVLDQSYAFERRGTFFRASLLLSHESDHETAHRYSTPGYLALNDLGLGFSFESHHGIWAWRGGTVGRLYVASCTDPARTCADRPGDTSVGGQIDFTVAVPGPGTWRVAPYLASSASGIHGRGAIRTEGRLSLRLGAYTALPRSVFTIFVLGYVGNDIGVLRSRALRTVGVGAAFSR